MRELPVAGLVLLGYPLHPPGRPEQRRDAHLPGVGRPMLFVQGSRDSFGTPGGAQAPILARLTRDRRSTSLTAAIIRSRCRQAREMDRDGASVRQRSTRSSAEIVRWIAASATADRADARF